MNVITDNDYFTEMVIDRQQGATLLLFFFQCWHMKSRLDINSIWWSVHHKVHFHLPSYELAIFILATKFHQTNIHIIATTTKFVVDDILHDVRLFLLAIVKNGSTNPPKV